MNRHIAIFDSGVGGLSIWREVRQLLPEVDLVYLADNSYAPYGDRSLLDIQARVHSIVDLLIGDGARMVVIACNTASAAALHSVRDLHPTVPIVGMEPAIKPAVETTRSGSVGVLATAATFQGDLFRSLIDRFARDAKVIARPCPGLADLVERGAPEPEIRKALAQHLKPLLDENVDTVVLGCTHYSFLAEEISRMSGIDVIDPAPAVARRVVQLSEGISGSGSNRFLTTGDPGQLQSRITQLLSLGSVKATYLAVDERTRSDG